MNTSESQPVPAVVPFAACWYLLVGLFALIAVPQGAENAVRLIVMWFLPAIVGSAGILWTVGRTSSLWPKIVTALSLVVVTPGIYFCGAPLPLLFMAIEEEIPGFVRNPGRISGGIVLILLMSTAVAWGLAAWGGRLIRRSNEATRGLLTWLLPFPIYLLLLVLFYAIGPAILGLACALGLYKEVGGFM